MWVEHPFTLCPIWPARSTSPHVWLGRTPDLGNEKYVVWAGLSLLPYCPAILLLEFQSTGNESPIVLLFGGRGHLLLTRCINARRKEKYIILNTIRSLGGSDGKAFACSAEDPGSIPGSGRSTGEGNGTPLQYSCLEYPMDRGAW